MNHTYPKHDRHMWAGRIIPDPSPSWEERQSLSIQKEDARQKRPKMKRLKPVKTTKVPPAKVDEVNGKPWWSVGAPPTKQEKWVDYIMAQAYSLGLTPERLKEQIEIQSKNGVLETRDVNRLYRVVYALEARNRTLSLEGKMAILESTIQTGLKSIGLRLINMSVRHPEGYGSGKIIIEWGKEQ